MLDRLRLGRVGLDEPAPQPERMAGRLEDRTAIDDRGGPVHPEADPFDHRGEMPGVDHQPVASGVMADRVEPDPPQPGGGERMPGQERVEAGDRRCGLFEGAGKCRELVEHPGCGAHRFAARGGADGWRQRCHRGRGWSETPPQRGRGRPRNGTRKRRQNLAKNNAIPGTWPGGVPGERDGGMTSAYLYRLIRTIRPEAVGPGFGVRRMSDNDNCRTI